MLIQGRDDQFRGDIELLRGLAVLLVVLFHLKLSFIKSGFIGVDIFFVISGYLMAAAFSDPNKSILQFYERRARRVLPAAFFIFAIFFALSPLFFLPFETKKVAESFFGTLLLAPNFIFWLENSYFDEFSFRPMLHYWSLGVEFQYYLLFPLLVYLFKQRKYLYFICFAGSFVMCLFLTEASSKTAFFLLPARVWEFFLGFYAFRFSKGDVALNLPWGRYVSLGALCGLVGVSFWAIPQNNFPGIYAAAPAILAFLFITFGLKNPDNFLFGSGKLLRFLGKISYSIYLIHYPVIFAFIYGPFSVWKPLTALNMVLAAGITLLLSVVSYRYVESPFRNRSRIPTSKFIFILCLFVAASVSLLLTYKKLDYFSYTYSKQEQKIFYAMEDQGKWLCDYFEKIKAKDAGSCNLVEGDYSSKKLLLVGDSHMDAIKNIFVEKAKATGDSVRLMKDSCVLGQGKCNANGIINEATKFHVTDIVLHGYKPDRFNFEELNLVFDRARSLQMKVHFIGPVPTYDKSVPRSLYDAVAKDEDIKSSLYTRESFLTNISLNYRNFKLANENKAATHFYDPSEYLCDPTCEVQGETGIYYHDSHHLSLTGSRLLIPLVDKIYASQPDAK